MNDLNRDKNKVVSLASNKKEQVPSQIRANRRNEINKSLKKRLGAGFRVDETGVANNYPIETKMSEAEDPDSKQPRQYIFVGAVAIAIVSLAIWIAFTVS